MSKRDVDMASELVTKLDQMSTTYILHLHFCVCH